MPAAPEPRSSPRPPVRLAVAACLAVALLSLGILRALDDPWTGRTGQIVFGKQTSKLSTGERYRGLMRCYFDRGFPEHRDRLTIDDWVRIGLRLSSAGVLVAALLGAATVGPHPSVAGPTAARREHVIGVRYDGPDLSDVAAAVGVPVGELVSRHLATEWTVAAVGFAPGFGYLTGPDPLFAELSRRPEPRRRVPVGSVALAAGMCAVYPAASPGGWHLIGTSSVPLFTADRTPPALLAAGDAVRFEALV